MSETNRLKLPFIMGSQAQKHVTHNEALLAVDALVQLAVVSRGLSAPPADPAEGARYIVGAAPSGAWMGQGGRIAAFDAGAWRFHLPAEGWRCWVADEARVLVHAAGTCQVLRAEGPEVVPKLGILTTPDAQNRFALKSNAALLTHDDVTPGTGHMTVTLNKSAAGRDGGLIFQTGYSSRALLGTFGSDAFQVKVSADGSVFSPVLVADPGGKLALGGPVDPAVVEPIQLRAPVRIHANKAVIEASSGTVALHLAHTQSGAHGGFLLSAGATGAFSIIDQQFGTRLTVASGGGIEPGADNVASLGSATRRFASVYAATGVIQTSDARDKAAISIFPGTLATSLLQAIDPVTFRWTDGETFASAEAERAGEGGGAAGPGDEGGATGTRELGFIAQDVRRALRAEAVDFGVWGLSDRDDPDSRQWLRPDQLLPILWSALKATRAELTELKARMDPTALPGS
ncbi:hypothetical protein ASG43_10790 [Aureimonas sp. Leaf454]|uniref:DUF2793 domain-containing protein n=1 Tax=Aureimonas sp. Leaf454 TaxID=1736381 RepID=UPI0006F59999|nr:DUF2793 domain-containing protein [Aureimonas sp. Leaf454]KQT47558.1 hypothetical protein ASG43_10790 [Aureimonas sp. Leaf454]